MDMPNELNQERKRYSADELPRLKVGQNVFVKFSISDKLVEQNVEGARLDLNGERVVTGRSRITLPALRGKGFGENKGTLYVADSAVEFIDDNKALVDITAGANFSPNTKTPDIYKPASYLEKVVASRLGKSALVYEIETPKKPGEGDGGDGGNGGSPALDGPTLSMDVENKRFDEEREHIRRFLVDPEPDGPSYDDELGFGL